MKIKQIESILKARKTIILFQDSENVQWLGDGSAAYPIFGLPNLTEQAIYTLFDIPEDKKTESLPAESR